MKFFLRMLALALLMSPTWASAASGARAWLDRDSMQLGETVTLNVEIDDSTATAPDFNVLLTDFRSLGTQSSRQVSMTNGTTSAKTIWAIGLEPKRAGSLVIPAFVMGSASTDPLTLTVLPAATGAQGKPGDNIFIEISADPLAPYVQQQVRYTVKLYFSVDLTEGTLDEPSASGAVVQKLGRDKQYVATLNGSRYHVLERDYALTPEQSGSLDIPALGFRGSSPDNSDPTGFFRRGRQVGARSNEIHLDVRAKPASWGAEPWLPAQSLSLTDETELPDEIKLGEPLTRTLKLRAQGLGFEQLPELELKAPDGTEIYPDKAVTQTRDDGTWLYGERTRKFAIVPTRPGKLVLPEVSVQWWDTAHDRIETALLPQREITVLAGASTGAAPATPSPVASGPEIPGTGAATEVVYPSADGGLVARRWRLVSFVLGALWLLTLAMWWRSRHSPIAIRAAGMPPPPLPGRSAFLRACSLGDLVGAERALVAWARGARPEIRNLGELASVLDDNAQREALDELQRVRYAGANSEGLATRLSRAFGSGFGWHARSTGDTESSVLPPLYPRHS